MSGKESKYAVLSSENHVEFEFPYGGSQTGSPLVDDEVGSEVMFTIEKGQIVGQGLDKYGTCVVNIKFDKDKDKWVEARQGGRSTSIVFTDRRVLQRLRKSKTFKVSPKVYSNGYPVFTFETSSLNATLTDSKTETPPRSR